MAVSRRRSGADMERRPIEDLPDEIRTDAEAANLLRHSNHRMLEKIERLGGSVDLLMARIEHFISYMVANGYLTEAAAWQEQLGWERHLRPQLQDNLQMMQGIVAEQQRKAAQSKLIVPGRG